MIEFGQRTPIFRQAQADIDCVVHPGGPVIGEIQTGVEVVAIGCKGDWIKLQLDNGAEGWALARTGNMQLLCPKEEPAKEAPKQEPAPRSSDRCSSLFVFVRDLSGAALCSECVRLP